MSNSSISSRAVAAAALLASAALTPCSAWALGQEQYVQFTESPGSFAVVNADTTATIYVDAKDWPGVARAAKDLANDLKDITGKAPQVVSGAEVTARTAIIIGTVGKSRLIDQLVAAGQATVYNVLAPNLPFIPGRDLKFAISIDDQAPVMVTGIPKTHAANGSAWVNNVKDEARIVSANVQIPSTGYHTLKVWMVDPGITIQKIFLDLGGLKKPTYLGPPETYYRPK